MTAAVQLPDDPATLRQLLAQREADLAERDRVITEQTAALAQIKQEAAERIEALQRQHAAELAALWQRLRGARTERFDPAQLLLFGLTINDLGEVVESATAPATAPAADQPAPRATPRLRHNHGRSPFPAHLPREIIEHDLTDQEKMCPCCGERRVRIGAERTEQLDVVPLRFKVLVHVQHKYACPACHDRAANPQIETAPKPLAPIARGVPSALLLALIIIHKFADHLPLYRLEAMFARGGVDLGRGTMGRWLLAAGALLQGLVNLMADRIRQGRRIATDETRLPVQDKPQRAPAAATGPPGPAPPPGAALPVSRDRPTSPATAPAAATAPPGAGAPTAAVAPPALSPAQALLLAPALAATLPATPGAAAGSPLPELPGSCPAGRMWVYLGDEAHPYTVFVYTPDRTRAGPARFLAGYRGHLQADAFSGFDGLYVRGVIEAGCWAHARRKFYEARTSDPRRSAAMLALIGELYGVERAAQARVAELRAARPEMTLEEQYGIVRALRQERSVPVLARIKAWLERESKLVLPRSPIALAINYVRNQWEALTVYTTQGFLAIDNNAAEREMKKIATGRKNWLFAGTEAGAQASANLYTLVASARRHGLDPLVYLSDVLARLPSLPVSQLPTLLPDAWQAARAATGDPARPPLASPAGSAPVGIATSRSADPG